MRRIDILIYKIEFMHRINFIFIFMFYYILIYLFINLCTNVIKDLRKKFNVLHVIL